MIYNYIIALGKILADFINTFLLIVIAISAIRLIYKIITLIKIYRNEYEDVERLKSDLLNINDLHNLSPKEFEYWCANFLEKEGFTDITVTCSGADGGKDIVCKKDDGIYYVECKRYANSDSTYNFVDTEIPRKLIGAMRGDNIKNGIIITTSKVTKEAENYINSLPEPYSLTLYDGEAIIKEYKESLTSCAVNA